MAITVLWSPVACYRSILEKSPAWGSALLPLALHTACTAATAGVTLTKVQSAVEGPITGGAAVALAVFSALFGVAVAFWLSTGGMIALDKLCNGHGDARRLIEYSAIAHWSQVPWGLVSVTLFAMWFQPEPLNIADSGSAGERLRAMELYRVSVESSSFMLTVGLVGAYFGVWLVALQACALRVVSGFTVRGAWAAGIVLGSVFVVIPWAVQRF